MQAIQSAQALHCRIIYNSKTCKKLQAFPEPTSPCSNLAITYGFFNSLFCSFSVVRYYRNYSIFQLRYYLVKNQTNALGMNHKTYLYLHLFLQLLFWSIVSSNCKLLIICFGGEGIKTSIVFCRIRNGRIILFAAEILLL